MRKPWANLLWVAAVLATVVGMAAAGRAVADTRGASRPTAPTGTPPKPREIKTEPSKPVLHAPTGFEFPRNVGAFRRSVAYAFDATGANLSVGYIDPALKIILTSYIYPPAGVPLDAHFRKSKDDLTQLNKSAKLLEEGSITLQHGKRGYEGLRARYQLRGLLGGVEQDLISELYLFTTGGHFVKFRLTYPAADAKAAATRVEFFLNALHFPEKPATRPVTP